MTKKSICTHFTDPDIYGQSHPVETPELIQQALETFDKAVSDLPDSKKKHLLEAQSKCPHLLTSDFKLMFLRCECFRIDDAVKRYTKFWDKKREIFGPERAWKKITLEELDEDEAALHLQFARLVQTVKDPSGRHILFWQTNKHPKEWNTITPEMMARAAAYVLSAALEDEETQKKGIVVLFYLKDEVMSQFNKNFLYLLVSAVQGALPVRMSAVHNIEPHYFFRFVFSIAHLLLSARMRKRLQVHAGSRDQIMESLQKYGLTPDKLPQEMGGTVVLDFEGWLEQRKREGK